jgi:hypothetical protein
MSQLKGYRMSSSPAEFRVQAPVSVRWQSLIMSAALVPAFATILVSRGWVPTLIIALVLIYPILFFAVDSRYLVVTPGILRTWYGPVPVPRGSRQMNPADIEAISWTLVRTLTGRGGRAEFFVLKATTIASAKPFVLIDTFRRENDARAVAEALVAWLNNNGLGPVILK